MQNRYWLMAALYALLLFPCAPAYAQRSLAAPINPPIEPPTPIVAAPCGTEPATEQEAQTWPWYADTVYLAHYYDSLRTALDGNAQARTLQNGVEDTWLRIPVQFWVYTDGGVAGAGNFRLPGPADFQNMMDALNDAFRQNGVKVRFYLLCPRVENDPDAVTINNATERILLALGNKVLGAVNIHICQNTDPLYTPLGDAIFLPRSLYGNRVNINTVPHEVGHYFGLEHTFLFCNIPCFREPVSRGYVWRPFCPQNLYPKTCAVTGDCLTDTEADHEDNRLNVTVHTTGGSTVCNYTGNRRDFWNDRFRPDATNLMSYMPRECRRTFSPQQRAVMLNNMFLRRWQELAAGAWLAQSPFFQFDRYEPDNADLLARILPIEVTQERSMQGTGCGSDTEDWVQLLVPVGGATASYILEVTDAPNFSNPITGVDFFTSVPATSIPAGDVRVAAGLPLPVALLSNINGIRRYLLACNVFNSQAARGILVRLTGSGSVFGRYRLTLEPNRPSLSGLRILCTATSEQYTINNLLPNSTVTWSITPTSVATLASSTGTSNTITGQTAGEATLTISITNNGCTTTLPPRIIGVTSSSWIHLQRVPTDEEVCLGTTVVVRATAYAGASVTGWHVDNGQLLYVIGNEASVQVSSSPGITNVYADYDSSCPGSNGDTAAIYFQVVDNKDGQTCVMMRTGAPQAAVYPNPADTYVDVRSPFAAAHPYQIELYNDRSQRMHEETASSSAVRLDTRSLPTGLYHLTLRQGHQTFKYNLNIQH